MKADFIIRGGRVMDPYTGADEIKDIVVRNTRIADPEGEYVECGHIIHADGCIVAPGLIDFHTHIFHEGSGSAIRPDFMISREQLLPWTQVLRVRLRTSHFINP